MSVFNADPCKFEIQQLAHGSISSAFCQRQYHALHPFSRGYLLYVGYSANDPWIDERLADVLAGFIEKANHFEIQLRAADDFANQRNTFSSGAQHQYPLRPLQLESLVLH